MKRVIYFDTSVATTNMGDHIITECCKKQLEFLTENEFIINFPTHTPISHWYQETKKTSGGRYMGEADYKFVFGTNLLNSNMVTPTPLWNLNVFNSRMAKGSICLGVGMGSDSINPNFYTKKLFSSILSKDYIHSTRDEKTAKFLRNMGLRAINTGCLTTWDLTNDFCAGIPTKKSDNVSNVPRSIFTNIQYIRLYIPIKNAL